MKAAALAATIGLCTFAPVPTFGQQITCEAPSESQPGTRPAFGWQSHFIALSRLGNHWMPFFGDGDSMTNPFWHDQGAAPPFGSAGLEETWYIARDPAAGRAPLYRLFDPATGNHMDSPLPAEGSHGLDLGSPHGHAWTSSQTGMKAMRRYYRTAINDHRTWLNSPTPAGYSTNATWSAASATPRFGYQRFGSKLDQCSVINHANSIGTKLQNSKVRVGFNPIWGNAIGEITHLPSGRQIVSHSLGDMAQSTLWYGGPAGGPLLNPTQSGGVDCWDYGATRRWTGSPVLSASLSGTNPKTFTTQVRPLNFCHNDFQGNDPWSPLAWQGLFRLTTTLGCRLGATTYDDVVKVRHEARKDAGAIPDNPINMNNVAWLIPHPFGDCRHSNVRFEVVNLATGLPEASYFPGCNDPTVRFFQTSEKGLMLTSADGTFAVGFARLNNAVGGSQPDPADELNFAFNCNFDCALNNQKIILNYHNFHNIGSSTFEREEIFYVLGTPTEVLTRLQQIWADGGSC